MSGRLSKAVLGLIAAGATSTMIAMQMAGENEGLSLKSYQDGAQVWTICYGHTAGVKPGQAASDARCKALLQSDMGQAFAALDAMAKVPLTVPQRAGLADWIYNVGAPKARTSSLMRKLNAGDRAGACDELRRWVIVSGRDCRKTASHCAGIVTRREQERALCLL